MMTPKELHAAATISKTHILPGDDSQRYGMQSILLRHGSEPDAEWEDTAARFAPAALLFYPDIPPLPGAGAYGVAYGELIAFDAEGGETATWNGEAWQRL